MILTSLLESNISCLTLMTGTVSTFVVQKLISVLSPDLLEPLVNEVIQNFTRLSLDSVGCRVVQSLLQAASPDQQMSIAVLLGHQKVLLTLAADKNGTFVAQVIYWNFVSVSHQSPSGLSLPPRL